jgi:hypothetical protein
MNVAICARCAVLMRCIMLLPRHWMCHRWPLDAGCITSFGRLAHETRTVKDRRLDAECITHSGRDALVRARRRAVIYVTVDVAVEVPTSSCWLSLAVWGVLDAALSGIGRRGRGSKSTRTAAGLPPLNAMIRDPR